MLSVEKEHYFFYSLTIWNYVTFAAKRIEPPLRFDHKHRDDRLVGGLASGRATRVRYDEDDSDLRYGKHHQELHMKMQELYRKEPER